MRQPLTDHAKTPYERPNQPWICGLACEGNACPFGPTVSGLCPELAECAPVRDGDRWQCNRSELRGGPCEEGPCEDGKCSHVNRCTPVAGLRSRRGRVVAACALFAVGAMLMVLGSRYRNELVDPGPLARNHAQIVSEEHAQSCAACHAAAQASAWSWLQAVVPGHPMEPTQSELCMNCHQDSIHAEFSLAAHSTAPARLEAIAAAHVSPKSPRLARTLFGTPGNDRGQLACAACHREHHGADFDLTKISDSACQACHHQEFQSFATDHPDFGVWPYERRPPIAFDHGNHEQKHFPAEKKAFECQMCHVDDATGTAKILLSYGQACGSCHDGRIDTSLAEGVELFSLPSIDDEALADVEINVGEWPDYATGDFDGAVPPLMKLLLAADPKAAVAMAHLGEDFQFGDVDPDSEEDLQAAADLLRAIKRLMTELQQSPQQTVRRRLAQALEIDADAQQLLILVRGLSPDTFRGAVAAWLPNLETETPDDSTPQNPLREEAIQAAPQAAVDSRAAQEVLQAAAPGTWVRHDGTFTIRYRPLGHADPLMTAWLELLLKRASAKDPLATATLEEITRVTAPGLCVSCHSIERADSGGLAIHWLGRDAGKEPRGFTKFSHEPHTLQPMLSDCTYCHAVDLQAESAAAYADWNASSFVRDFLPMAKSQCTECHNKTAANEACTQCHNYHVDPERAPAFHATDWLAGE